MNNKIPENFNWRFYLNHYEDLRLAGLKTEEDAKNHYLKYGKKENRIYHSYDISQNNSNIFDFQFYQNNNVDEKYVKFKRKEKFKSDIKLIAFYLPQFHPIPENDKSYGKGFTEWSNVSKAIPQFKNHYQPRLPGELGYYDLRIIDIQKRQIELAKNYGLYGFCYHYYWFNGKKIMDKPLQQVLENPELDFPFCINWANEGWYKKWNGMNGNNIITQNHDDNDLKFIKDIEHVLKDKRYIKINNKPLLLIYKPSLFPNIKRTINIWRKYCIESGIGDLYLVLTQSFEDHNPTYMGFDAAVDYAPNRFNPVDITNKFTFYNKNYKGIIYDYNSLVINSKKYKKPNYTKFRSICPSWDNEARYPGSGITFANSTPENYSIWLKNILEYTDENLNDNEKMVFINAWNEWAEGAYLEPDKKYGYAYLEKTYETLKNFK